MVVKTKSSFYQLLCLFLFVIALYFPSILAPFNTVDDLKMVHDLLNTDTVSVKGIFLPHSYGQYYRPLLYLTFIADNFLWGLEASFMHLENILLHLGNTLLVFWLTKQSLPTTKLTSCFYAPFATSLLFGLHPIATEPVNWISGRTDLLSGFFIILSFGLFLRAKQSTCASSFSVGLSDSYVKFVGLLQFYIWSLLGAVSFLAGCLSKETALFILPVILAWCLLPESDSRNSQNGSTLLAPPSCYLCIFLFVIYGSAGTVYLVLRWLALSGGDKIVKTATKMATTSGNAESAVGILDVARVATKTAGFYFKKLLIPVPLNFGINSISPHYFWLGLLVLCGAAWCIYKRDTISYFFLAAFMLTSSAFVLPILKITWTPIAERYVYIASAPFLIGVTLLYIKFFADKFSVRVTTLVVAAVLGSAAIVTARRNIIWQDNLTLFQDTVQKSPDFGAIKNEYAIALRNHGRTAEANEIMMSNVVDEFQPSSLNKIKILVNQGKLEDGRMMLLDRLKKSSDYDQLSYELLLKIDEMRREKAIENSEKRSIDRDILADFQKLISLKGDPFYHYRIGIIQLRLGEQKEAKSSFTKAWRGSSPNSHYHDAAKKLAAKL